MCAAQVLFPELFLFDARRGETVGAVLTIKHGGMGHLRNALRVLGRDLEGRPVFVPP
jgi:hypothetical protein